MIMRLQGLILISIFSSVVADNLTAICGSADSQLSCGKCIQGNPLCAWCIDPHLSASTPRCQPKSTFEQKKTCDPQYTYSPVTELVVPTFNLPLGALHADGRSSVRLSPQHARLRMKPGEELIVPFKYTFKSDPLRPNNGNEMIIQTSQFHQSKGVHLDFTIKCNGKETHEKQCRDVKDGQEIEFSIKVSLLNCSNDGDVTISVGVYGYNSVSAIYVTPICGCECERLQRMEKNSPLCNSFGNLICGQCVCDPKHGGERCECPLSTFGVKNAFELEQKCRKTPSSDICEGKGSCKCGRCECKTPTVSGPFCDCDSSGCPGNCSNNGECQCGKCKCEEGWERDDCSCTTDKKTCMENGAECSGNGHCECGKCVCDAGFTGAFCGSVDEMHKPVTHETDDNAQEEDQAKEEDKSSSEEEDSNPDASSEPQTASSFTMLLTSLFSFVIIFLS